MKNQYKPQMNMQAEEYPQQHQNGNGNGHPQQQVEEESKQPSLLDKLHGEWVAGGKKLPDKATSAKIFDRVRNAEKKTASLLEELEKAREEQRGAAIELVKNFGKKTFDIKGLGSYVLSCRGNFIYLRQERTDRETVSG